MDTQVMDMKRVVIEGMRQYMRYGSAEGPDDEAFDPAFDAGYSELHVQQCDHILTRMLKALDQVRMSGENAAILDVVKQAVLELNALNDACEGTLIETDQREQIVPLILTAAREAGLSPSLGDVTEAWREW